jgi:hypothetical protein
MRTGRPTPLVVLTAEERQTLEQWARRPTTAQGLAQRAPRPGVRLDQDQRGDRDHGRRHAANGGALAASLRPEAVAGAAG